MFGAIPQCFAMSYVSRGTSALGDLVPAVSVVFVTSVVRSATFALCSSGSCAVSPTSGVIVQGSGGDWSVPSA